MNQGFAALNDVGQKIEWLVDASDKDNLHPVATILRWFIAGEDGTDKYRVLVVTQLKLGATCRIALIDAQSVKDANAAARKIGPGEGRQFRLRRRPELVQPYKVRDEGTGPGVE